MTARNSVDNNSLDTILVRLGDFGRYQIGVFALVCFAVVLHSAVHVAFVFTAMDLDYRCKIPNCDTESSEYAASWVKSAVPISNGRLEKCSVYQSYANETIFEENCTEGEFNTQIIERCSSFVYKSDEKTILQEYDLQCDNNLWKLTMIGTINNVGQFFGLLISGILSDRYGRRVLLVGGMVLCGVCGIIRTFMPTYEWFLVLEFMDAFFGAGSYICGFVLGVELVGPKKRVLTGTLVSSCYAVGEVFAAVSAYLVKSWKPLIYILYTPTILLLSYFWLVPESIRWNLSKGRIEEAKKTMIKLATVNGKQITDKELEILDAIPVSDAEVTKSGSQFAEAIRSSTLMIRLVTCCFCWITCAFLFYGLTLNSVALAGNAYVDFILTSLVEIPAYFACNFIVERYGRKRSLFQCYLLTGIACLAFIFIPDSRWGSLCVYLIGKFGATASFTILYVITSEMFPTNLRHSFMGTCSTLGRCGSMISPQTPLLAQIWEPLPLVSFAAMSSIAAGLALTFPETLNKKLPDTVKEAKEIGKVAEIEQEIYKAQRQEKERY
ncbi:solute carrier family 22 member 3-like isoform X2 [Cylas formicarius]|uniref:solute carrier family 22 member 3-like isoform X2 n=1 Tax=Cylas formicarius TaxID=197179 RepID=UPI002958C258|nr:solute carrier family 22 member 3-like isoform X2 [Cylas formicarius]